jgi:putative transposase
MRRRRSIRLADYDYSQVGAYFVTICTYNQASLLGEITDQGQLFTESGRMVKAVWEDLPTRFPHVELDEFIVMPNHFHGIIVIHKTTHRRGESCIRPNVKGDHKDRPYDGGVNRGGDPHKRPRGTRADSLGRIIQAFKSITTVEYIKGVKQHGWPRFAGKLWQRNYYERIIRDENELDRIRNYIMNNPIRLQWDWNSPDA